MNAHIDDQEPQDAHKTSCAIWKTNDKPCDCRDTTTVWDADAEAARYFGGQGW